MNLTPEISFKDVPSTDHLKGLIQEKAAKLETFCDHITSCQVAVERDQHKHAGSPYRVRIDLRIPPGHEVVVKHEPGQGEKHESLQTILTQTFHRAERSVRKLKEKQKESR